jgi:hypothetical protein
MTCPSEKTPVVIGVERFDIEATKQAFGRDMMANGMRDVNATHGTRAAVVKAAKAVKQIFLQTPNLATIE